MIKTYSIEYLSLASAGFAGDIKQLNIASMKTAFVATTFLTTARLPHHKLEKQLVPKGIIVAYDRMRLEV